MKWSKEKATSWYEEQPWLVGCNFLPSSAINQLEMFQDDTFDEKTMARTRFFLFVASIPQIIPDKKEIIMPPYTTNN